MADSRKGVGKDAPKLVFIRDKWNYKGTHYKAQTATNCGWPQYKQYRRR